MLYHYTTQAGLIGILNEKSIWASHIAYLNDSSEFKRGLEIIERNVRELKIDRTKSFLAHSPEGQVEAVEQTVRGSVSQVLRIMDEVDVFVASFFDSSKAPPGQPDWDQGDNLEQWRAYSGNAGVSVGFDKERLSAYIAVIGENPKAPIACGPCNYDQRFQERYLSDRVAEIGPTLLEPFNAVIDDFIAKGMQPILDELERNLSTLPIETLIEQAKARAMADLMGRVERMTGKFNSQAVALLVQMLIPPVFMKHPAFGAENEWRIAQLSFGDASSTRFRPGTFSLIPYVAIPLPWEEPDPDLLIRRIVVAPSPKSDQAVAAVKMLGRSHGLKIRNPNEGARVEIVASKIPYRPW